MPSSCGYTWSPELDAVIRQESAAQGVPLDLAYAIIGPESGFDPNAAAVTPFEDSHGLLQLNRRGGQGAGYSIAQLRDPATNLRIGLPYIRRAFEQSWSTDIEPYEFIYQVATRSGHPGPVARNDVRIRTIANAWACFYHGSGASLMGPQGSTTPASSPGPALAADIALLVMFPFAFTATLIYVGARVVVADPILKIFRPPVTRRAVLPVSRPSVPAFDFRRRRSR